jgi:hypothetical protein
VRPAQTVLNGGELDGRRHLSKKMVEFMLSDRIVGMGHDDSDDGIGVGESCPVRQ